MATAGGPGILELLIQGGMTAFKALDSASTSVKPNSHFLCDFE